MAISSTSIFKSNATYAGYLNPQIWSEAIEQVARENTFMPALGLTDTRMLGKAGFQLNISKNTAFVAATLTEGTATPVTTITGGQVTVTFNEEGLAKQISELELAYGIRALFNDTTMNMGMALAERKDRKILDILSAGAANTIYADGVTTGAISASNVFSTDLLADGITTIRANKRKAQSLIIHPNCENSLLKDSQFVDASQYGGRETVLNGEIGRYLGIRIISYSLVNSSSENSVDVYQNVLLGDRAFVYAPKVGIKLRWREDSILDRAITFEAHETYGQSVLNSESIVVLKSTTGVGQ